VADAEEPAVQGVHGRAVGGAVVGEDAFDVDAVAGEEGDCAAQETGSGFGAFIGEHFDVGEPAVVVDRDVDEVPAGVAGPAAVDRDLALALSAAADAVAGTRNAAQILDVDVHELARPLTLVADGLLEPDPSEPAHPKPTQHT